MSRSTLLLVILTVSCARHSAVTTPVTTAVMPAAGATTLTLRSIPELGSVLPGLPASHTRTLASSAQLWPSYEAVVDGIAFTIGVDDRSRVRFVSTHDARFVSPEGLRTGASMDATLRTAKEPLFAEAGWGHYVELPSGWSVLLEDAARMVDGRMDFNLGTRDLRPDARISMFFKRGGGE
ncbi:MAG TPA: hypothetical protein VN605_05050 [Thermoanaerobaculia bacterium]|nr:hypothetical protein [Thermoanaerobaculia bacterium]